MPQVQINNRNCDLDIQSIRTVQELIPKIKDSFLEDNEVLSEIVLDDISLSPSHSSHLFKDNIQKFKSLHFKTHKASIAHETLHEIPDFIDKMICSIANFSTKDRESDNELYAIIEKVDLFIQLMNEINKALTVKTDEKLAIGLSIKELQVHLLFVIKGINSAFRKKDKFVLQDLLEHELIDNLTKWKIQVIPKIKKLSSF